MAGSTKKFLPWLIVAACFGSAQSGTIIAVRGRPAIHIDGTVRTANGVQISGSVTEQSSGQPLGFVEITLDTLRGHAATITDENGRFAVEVADPSPGQVTAQIAGDRLLTPASQTLSRVEPDRAKVGIVWEIAPMSSGQPLLATLTATAITALTREELLPDAALQIRISDSYGLLINRDVVTNYKGQARVEIPNQELGRAGVKQIVATFAGSDRLQAVSVAQTTNLERDVQLSITQNPGEVGFGEPLEASANLSDDLQNPLSGQILRLRSQTAILAEAVTDDDGNAHFTQATPPLAAGDNSLWVEFRGSPFLQAGKSEPFVVTSTSAHRVPLGIILMGIVIITLLFFGLRMLERWRKQARPTAPMVSTRLAEGLVPNQTAVSTEWHHDISGTVIDPFGEAIADVSLQIFGAGAEPHLLSSGERGQFSFQLPSPSNASRTVLDLLITKDGFRPLRVLCEIPHHGQFHQCRLVMMPLREVLFDLYRQIATPLLPRPGLAAIWSPRKILRHVAGAQGLTGSQKSREIEHLTNFVEDRYFSSEPTTEEDVAQARQLATFINPLAVVHTPSTAIQTETVP